MFVHDDSQFSGGIYNPQKRMVATPHFLNKRIISINNQTLSVS